MNTGVHVFFPIRVFIFSKYMPRNGIAGLYSSSTFSFLRNLHTVLYSVCTHLHSHQQWRTSFSPHSPKHLLFIDFLMKAIWLILVLWYRLCDCDLHFSNNLQCWAFFTCASWPSGWFLQWNVYLGLLTIFSLSCLFLVT